jgi:hypothetical protein
VKRVGSGALKAATYQITLEVPSAYLYSLVDVRKNSKSKASNSYLFYPKSNLD